MAQFELRLLGPFHATLNGKPITGFESNKVRALLAFLAVETYLPQPRESLAGLLWPDWPQQAAMKNLSYALGDLRKNIGDREANPPFLLIHRESIQLNLESDCWVDVGEFEKQSAIALYRGDFLQGFSLKDSSEFEQWVLAKREYYKRQAIQILGSLTESCQQTGEYDLAMAYARRQLELEPWLEEAHRQLLRLLAMSGQRSAALVQYETCRKLLQNELGVEPSEETILLYKQIRSGTLAAAPGPITHAKVEEFPGIESPASTAHNLPAQLSSFVGRERDIKDIYPRITGSENRLVTLTGIGGVGKTRLALRVAQEVLGEFLDGVWWVDLASLADPGLVVQSVAAVFGVQESKDSMLIESLANTLRLKRLLLVLDNCEHLVEASVSLAVKLLQSCPNVSILATSREILGVEGELNYPVRSFAFPDPSHMPPLEDLCQYEAVCLFIARAQTASPDFTVTEENASSIARICQQLDGIPLAIELAAARVKMLDVNLISARLEENFKLLAGGHRMALPRQQTVRASIEWSYCLLPEAEQALLRRLSVFAVGWKLEAAGEVGVAENHPDGEILDLLTQLVNKSLVIVERGQGQERRYRLLGMVRQYAHEQLEKVGEVEWINDRHLAYFLHLAEAVKPMLWTDQRLVSLKRLSVELENLRAALRWSLDRAHSQNHADGLRLATALKDLWIVEGLSNEGLSWVEKGLAFTEEEIPEAIALRANGLYTAGSLLFAINHFLEATWNLEECITLSNQAGDRRLLSQALSSLALALLRSGNSETARIVASEAFEVARQSGDRWSLAFALISNGWVCLSFQERKLVQAYAEESLALFQETGDRWTAAQWLKILGALALEQGDYEAARAHFLKFLELSREGKDKHGTMWGLTLMGEVAHQQENFSQMEIYFRECLDTCREMGFKMGEIWSLHHLGIAVLRQGDDKQAAGLMVEGLAIALETRNSLRTKEFLDGAASIAGFRGQLARAAWLFGAAEEIFGEMPISRVDRTNREQDIARLHAQMDEAAFQAAWDEGRGLTLERAILEARAICDKAPNLSAARLPAVFE